MRLGLEPAPDALSVLLPSGAMGPRQPGFLAEHDPQVKDERDGQCIDEQADRTERNSPTQQDQGHGHIHRVAAVAVQADDYQLLRWRPRGEGALARYVKIPGTPEQAGKTEYDQEQAERPMQREISEPDPSSRHQKSHDAGQCQECYGSSREDWYGPWRLDQADPGSGFGLNELLERTTTKCLDVTEELLLVARRDH